MCPIIVNITQLKRSSFHRGHNICTVCLVNKGHTPDRCPEADKISRFLCSDPTCFNRSSLCPNPKLHMNLTSEQIEPRMSRAVEAGMLVTYLNTTINAREQIEKLKKEIEMHEKLSESLLGDVIKREDVPVSTKLSE